MTSFIRLPKPLASGLAVIIAAVGLFVLFSILTAPPQPQPPLDVVNGTWVSSDGGMLTLRDGKLSSGTASTTYVIETDKQGTYVLLDGRLVAGDGGQIGVERNQNWMKSYLDEPDGPSRISFWIDRGAASKKPNIVAFDRQPEREPDVR